MYYLTKLFRQQYNVNNKYFKHLGNLYFKKTLQTNFRLKFQLQPYQVIMHPYFQGLKTVYLKDTIFNTQYTLQSSLEGHTVLKKYFYTKTLKNNVGLNFFQVFYGGSNFALRPKTYKYAILPNVHNFAGDLNPLFKNAAAFKNIV